MNAIQNDPMPVEALPYMGVLVAEMLHSGDISSFLRGEPTEALQAMKRHYLENEPLLQLYQARLGLPLNGPSDSVTKFIPAIDAKLLRRRRPSFTGTSRIAEIKAARNLLDVAQRYTKMTRCGPGKFKGLCPLHHERSPSFYVFENSNKFHCFGCLKHGDVFDLLVLMGGRNV